MNTLSSETLREITNAMPEKIRDLYMGTSEISVVEVCDEIGEQLSLSPLQINSLISIVGEILLGKISLAALNESIQKITEDTEKTNTVAKEIETKLFTDIKNDLGGRYTAFAKYREPEKTIPVTSIPLVKDTSKAEPAPVTPPQPQPAIQSQTTSTPAPEPFINTQSVRTETVHSLDREALLRELESPEPYNVPFTPRKTTFEEKMNPVAPVPPQTQNTPAPKPVQAHGTDPYREDPLV